MEPVVTFGIPLAPKEKTEDWGKAMANLNRTLNSLENQTCGAYNVVLVGYYLDPILLEKKYRNMSIEYIDTMEEFSADKDAKTRITMRSHVDFGAKFYFRLDWDDLLHRNLVKFLADNQKSNGWAITSGYFYRPDYNQVIPIKDYWRQCGSAFAIDYNKEECINGPAHSFHHQQIPMNRAKEGKPLQQIPFFAGCYTIHQHNLSKEKHSRIFKDARWLEIKEVNPMIPIDFGI